MQTNSRNSGFSLTEILIAVGILTLGMFLVAGAFPLAISFTQLSTERTIAAVAADEAFAKIKLCGIDLEAFPSATQPFEGVSQIVVSESEYAYPSLPGDDETRRQYFWSAICRRIGTTRAVQVTVFVSRKTQSAIEYYAPDADPINRPVAVPVSVTGVIPPDHITIDPAKKTFINEGSKIVDEVTGIIYRVLDRTDNIVTLDRSWQGGNVFVWVVPPPIEGGRNPCVAVYQKVIEF